MPRLDGPQNRLAAIQGQVPGLFERPAGCSFAARCPFAVARSALEKPPLRALGGQHQAACRLAPLDVDALLPPVTEGAHA